MDPIIGVERVKTVRDTAHGLSLHLRDSAHGLSLRLLGLPRVEVDGQSVAFATRKTLALLAYLVVERGPHAREKVTALLWPDSDAAHGRAALRTTLAYVRTALGPEAARLRADRARVEFESDGAWLDLQALDADSVGTFLDGLSVADAPEFEEWLTVQRERWRRQVAHVLKQTTRRTSAPLSWPRPRRPPNAGWRWTRSARPPCAVCSRPTWPPASPPTPGRPTPRLERDCCAK
jgi:hypothetical protein